MKLKCAINVSGGVSSEKDVSNPNTSLDALKQRLDELIIPSKVSELTNDSGYITGVTVSSSGTGNAITAVSASGKAITVTKGNSFLPLSGGTLTGTVKGTTFVGDLTGNADTATKATSADSATTATSADKATKLATARNINGLSFDGTANRVNYGSCSTAAATAAKTVACTGFALVTGAEITVKFTVTNTASSPTLNVNNTGDKAIHYRGTPINAGYLAANRTYTFRYNGSQYELVGDINTDTNTDTKVTQSPNTTTNYRPLLMGFANSTDHTSLGIDSTNISYVNASIYAQPSSGSVYANKFVGNLTGNADTATTANKATKLATARTLTIGSTGKTFDGSGNVSWSLAEIGAAASSHTHSYLPLSGGTMTGTVSSSKVTTTYLTGNNGGAIINSTASAGSYVMLAKMNSTNGKFTTGTHQGKYLLQYTSNTTISAETNAVDKSVTLLDESGNSTFPGTVTASAFSGNASSATKLATARNINGLSFNGTANRVNYTSCSTAAATAAKTVDCPGFELITGAEITVKFTVTNTASPVTLNVNGTGAKAIYYRGSAISAGYLAANRTYTFRYNGAQYDLVGDIDTNTNTDTKVTQSGTTTEKYRPLLLGYANSTDTSTLTTSYINQVYANTAIYAQPSSGTIYANTIVPNGISLGEGISSGHGWLDVYYNNSAVSNMFGGSDGLVLKPVTSNTGYIGVGNAKFKAMYATTFYGALSGNASTASGLSTYINIGDKSSSANMYTLVSTVSIGTWSHYYGVYAIASRHSGTGILILELGCEAGTVSQANVNAQCIYYGSDSGSEGTARILSNTFQIYLSSDGSKAYIFARTYDKTIINFKILQQSGISLSNGATMTSIDTATYGTKKCGTTVIGPAKINKYCVDSSWLNLTASTTYISSHNLKYRKYGQYVELQGSFTPKVNGGSLNSFVTLPSGYRPSTTRRFSCPDNSGNHFTITINTDGTVTAGSNSGSFFKSTESYIISVGFLLG